MHARKHVTGENYVRASPSAAPGIQSAPKMCATDSNADVSPSVLVADAMSLPYMISAARCSMVSAPASRVM